MPTINGFSSQISSLSLNFESINNSQVKGSEPISIVIDPKDLNISLNQNSPKTIRVSSKDTEIQLFKKFGFDVKNSDELAALKQRFGKDPFAHVETSSHGYTAKLENGKYVIKTTIETKLLKELKGIAAQAESESPIGNIATRDNPNSVEAVRSGNDIARQRAAIEKNFPPRIPGHVPGLPPGDLKNAVEKFQKVEKMADELGQVARQALAQPGALDALLDEAQGALDLIGIVDPTPLSDGASAVISLAREQYGYAALSIVAAVLPYAGDAVKLAKLPKLTKSAEHAVELAAAAPKMTEKTLEKLQALKKVLDDVPLEGVPKATREAVEGLAKKVDTAIDTSRVAPRTVKEVSELAQQIKAGRTQPSLAPDAMRTPRGIAEKIPIKGDADTIRGLTKQNESAELMSKAGYHVEYQPKITPEDIKRNPSLKDIKDPDFRIEGKIFDSLAVKENPLASPKNLSMNIRDKIAKKVADGQTTRIVLNLDDSKVVLSDLKQALADTPIKNLEEIIIVKDKKISHFYPFK